MKRAIAAVIASFAGLGWLLSYHPPQTLASPNTPDPLLESTDDPSAASTSSVVESTTTTLQSTTTTTAGKATSPKLSTTTTQASTTTTTAIPTRKLTGSVQTNQYGPVQVAISVQGKRITGIQVLAYPNADPTSVSINATAIPKLKSAVLTAQSANLANVSGATYTTNSFKASLQSALDQI